MPDRESPNIEAAAEMARYVEAPHDDDRPSPTEIDDELAYERRSKLIDGAWTPGSGIDEEAGW